jgi:HEPN domain-containing protein
MHEAKYWFYFAESDLKAAHALLKSEYPSVGHILFLSQQCGEKALKAFLAHKGQTINKTHDLALLIKKCTALDAEFETFLNSAAELTPYATESRYPDSRFTMPDLSVAEHSIKQAEQILKFVENKIW